MASETLNATIGALDLGLTDAARQTWMRAILASILVGMRAAAYSPHH